MSVELLDLTKGYICLSTDTKPTAPSHDLLYETDTGIHYVWNGSAWVVYSEPVNTAQARSDFLAQILAIAGDSPVVFLPDEADTTTSTDATRNQRTITHGATLAGRIGRLGKGFYATYDGSADYSYVADADALSFGNASADEAFSMAFVVNMTNTANNRTLAGKYTTNQREYRCYVNTADILLVQLMDESTDGIEQVATNAAITQDDWILVGFSYDGSEDSDGIIVYVNGLPVATTAASDQGGTYTAMENGTSVLGIGTGTNSASLPFQGSMAMFLLAPKAISAAEWWQLREACNGYFGFLG